MATVAPISVETPAGHAELTTLSALVGTIYDTIMEPEGWPDVLARLAAYVGATRSILILEDAVETERSAFYVSFHDPEWVRLYLDQYLLLNPMRLALFGQAEAGAVLLTSDLMTPQEYARSRFAREFLALRDVVDLAVVVLEATATTITVLSFGRSRAQGFADEQVRQKLEQIGPHVQRAATIGRVLNRKTLDASTLTETLDRLDGAIFLLDGAGGIVHSNSSARSMLSKRRDAISTSGRAFLPAQPEARAILADALTRAAKGDDALGAGGVSIIFDKSGSVHLIGSLISLVDGSRRTIAESHRAVAALFVREVRFDTRSVASVLSQLYGLTKRETTVLAGINEFGGVPRTADIMGLTRETVRTHLKSIFRKTGTNSQTDLIKLLAETASPFRINK